LAAFVAKQVGLVLFFWLCATVNPQSSV